MGKKKMDVMEKERKKFVYGEDDENGNIIIYGCVRNGVSEEVANKIFDDMIDFAVMPLINLTQQLMEYYHIKQHI